MSSQETILRELAKKHGLQLQQAEEIWKLFGANIADVIGKAPKKDKQGLFDIESFPVIHIDSFGKFIPRTSFIKRNNKLKKNDSKYNTTN